MSATRARTGGDVDGDGSSTGLRLLGLLGLAGVLASVFLITAGAASGPTQLVPGRSGGWPGWLAGPFEGLGLGISSGSFQTLTLIMCAGYLLVLVGARALPWMQTASAKW